MRGKVSANFDPKNLPTSIWIRKTLSFYKNNVVLSPSNSKRGQAESQNERGKQMKLIQRNLVEQSAMWLV